MNRRELITGLISLVAAPAIVRVSSIMPVKSLIMRTPYVIVGHLGYDLAVIAEQYNSMGCVSSYLIRNVGGEVGDRVWINRDTGEMV